MYKMDRSIAKMKTFNEAEESKKFSANVPLGERLKQAWYLTSMAFGIDPENPPRMEKRLVSIKRRK